MLKRKLTVAGLTGSEVEDFIHELNHHPCVAFAELKPGNQLKVIYDDAHWSTDQLLELIQAYVGQLRNGWWTRNTKAKTLLSATHKSIVPEISGKAFIPVNTDSHR